MRKKEKYNSSWFKKGHARSNTGKTIFHKGDTPWNKGLTKNSDNRLMLISKKVSENAKNNPNFGTRNKKISEDHKRKIKLAAKINPNFGFRGKKHTICSKNLMSEANKGEKSFLWAGGISYEPYSVDLTKTLKRSIRERDKYICQIFFDYGNHVHHIDYNKKNCNPYNLITLCVKCHSKTNINRSNWIILLNSIINTKYYVK